MQLEFTNCPIYVLTTNHLDIKRWASLRGYCTPNQKLACFMLYLKIINTFLKIIYASYSKLSKKLKKKKASKFR